MPILTVSPGDLETVLLDYQTPGTIIECTAGDHPLPERWGPGLSGCLIRFKAGSRVLSPLRDGVSQTSSIHGVSGLDIEFEGTDGVSGDAEWALEKVCYVESTGKINVTNCYIPPGNGKAKWQVGQGGAAWFVGGDMSEGRVNVRNGGRVRFFDLGGNAPSLGLLSVVEGSVFGDLSAVSSCSMERAMVHDVAW